MNRQDVNIHPISNEENAQMVSMYNWAATCPMIQKMSMYTFKQRSHKDKVTRLWYQLESIIMTPKGEWKTIQEKGRTLTEAMQNWSSVWQEKSVLWST